MKGSLENIVDAVVSIQGGEVALKNTNNTAGSKLANQRRMNTDTSKAEQQKQGSNFDSPSKGGRQVYSKTQIVTQDESRGLQPQARAINAQPLKTTGIA
mmetsp:Transcript_21775/g.29192  ORF Transcript_21775/g.29192 Transcript_21775/m.29192 type:complete len:99 (+) Transcript_21775:2166-2462(+)|eukprot:CAMPEP_0185594568 /NCGR_PEP_ID=MMETSP0434-20130131/75444_1 /TAXON_ID=626734 ORGANISM="Favella taraikaensis, Strain Fe Narragansett Bay" /NCGR_SAMPLE_ID=MMETSP0434 /ASSEMBLY_ACC=CAM_ASM_000379 /LENGTH=98 /DNA_ID=CAMNT_0028222019 /DNA_START=2158 /DNA_END=2454 /DNA_ORIENTATION=-